LAAHSSAARDPWRAPAWSRIDTIALASLVAAATVLHFWHLGYPPEIVFDEKFTVSQARCYLMHLPYRTTHPPVAAMTTAVLMWVLGDQPVAWRIGSATLGTVLVGVTYLLGRRVLNSGVGATCVAGFVLCDGLFLADSRLCLWEIYYLTFLAVAYLMLARFVQTPDVREGRRYLAIMGAMLGLALGSKFALPAIGAILVTVFAALSLIVRMSGSRDKIDLRRAMPLIIDMVALVGGTTAFVYLGLFFLNYWFGWWGGIEDHLTYVKQELHSQTLMVGAHPYASQWWTWPLMLRPLLYWFQTNFFNDPQMPTSSIRGMGNPIVWWAVVAAMVSAIARAVAQRENFLREVLSDWRWAFVVVGYLAFYIVWIPVARYKFIYYYMPALYFGFFALADLLDRCWNGRAKTVEQGALLAVLVPALLLSFGVFAAMVITILIAAAYAIATWRDARVAGKFASVIFLLAVGGSFVYFLPLWTGIPMSHSAFDARLWFRGPGLPNWL